MGDTPDEAATALPPPEVAQDEATTVSPVPLGSDDMRTASDTPLNDNSKDPVVNIDVDGEAEGESDGIPWAQFRKVILAACIGNVLEWYDFAVFGAFVREISATFFPAPKGCIPMICDALNATCVPVECDGGSTGLLKTFAVFGAAFIMRPVGGIILGVFGDRFGRKAALQLSIALMVFPSLIMVFLPGYQTLGITASLLLFLIRLLQGIAVGGELVGSILYMVESANKKQRGLFGAFCFSFAILGTGLGMGVAEVTKMAMNDEEDSCNYGWRICFFLGFLMGVGGVFLRRGLEDSVEFEKAKEAAGDLVPANPLKQALTEYPKEVAFVCLSTSIWCCGFYTTFVWIGTFYGIMADSEDPKAGGGITGCDALGDIVDGPSHGHHAAIAEHANGIAFLELVILFFMFPLMGWVSDHSSRFFGWMECLPGPLGIKVEDGDRLIVMLWGAMGCAFLSIPIFSIFLSTQNVLGAIITQTLFAVLMAMVGAPMSAWFVEVFPPLVRYCGVGTGYNLAQAIFGGTAPFMATYLSKEFKDPLNPSPWDALAVMYWMSFVAVVGFIGMLWARSYDTANKSAEDGLSTQLSTKNDGQGDRQL